MLKSIIKYRPTNLHVVYVEPLRIEVIQAHRHWRSWEIGVAEQSLVPRGESVFDHLQYLNLKPQGQERKRPAGHCVERFLFRPQ